jgi:hypothetical protein
MVPTLAQLPALPPTTTAHDLQLPQGPLEQQTPSVHIVERHCAPVVQGDPSGRRFVQDPDWQVSPETQSALLPQVVRHWLLPAQT